MTTIEVPISTQAKSLLEQLAERGVYGVDAGEVAARFIDSCLQTFVEPPRWDARTPKLEPIPEDADG